MDLRTFLQSVSTKTKSFFSKLGAYFSNLNLKNKKIIFSGIFLLCAALIIFLIFSHNKTYVQETYIPPEGALYVDYAPDTVSKGQELKVTIPSDITADPLFSISVEPHVKFTSRNEGNIYYLMVDQSLPDNSEVAVVVKANNNIYVDFVYVENLPQILQMYPPEGTVLDATNSVSIIFDKPVVALESVSKQTAVNFSPTITPQIEGTWQWMGTDTLQFVPKTKFNTSTLYTVSFDSEFLEFDGHQITIKPEFLQRTFSVKPIELVTSTIPESVSKPLVLEYSLPVDADKTIPLISLKNVTTGKNVPATITVKENKISILPKSNNEGIAGFDFGESYTVLVNKVFPKVGNISVDTPESFSLNINDLVTDSYSTYQDEYIPRDKVNSTVIHPSGELHLIMSEEIDISSLVVDRKIISSIAYGKECVEDCYYSRAEGKGVTSYKHLVLKFLPANLPAQDSLDITFSNIKSRQGYYLTRKPYLVSFKKLEKLALFTPLVVEGKNPYSDMPNRKSLGVGGATLCSNYPIQRPEKPKESWRQFIQFSGGTSNLFGWHESVNYEGFSYEYNCPQGTYVTILDVGLDPNTEYTMNVSVSDVYDQKVSSSLKFNSGPFTPNDKSISALQPSAVITQPGDTQLAYDVRNMPTLSVSVCEMGPGQYILSRLSGRSGKVNCISEFTKTIPGSIRNWKSHLVGVPVSQITGKNLGFFRLVVGDNENSVTSWIQISQLAVIEKKSKNSTYFVFDSKTLQAVPKAEVSTGTTNYNNEESSYSLSSLSKLGQTNVSGKLTKQAEEHDFSIVSAGGDATVLMNNSDTMAYGGYEPPTLKTYIYTDRPIYKPGGTIEWKSISRDTTNNVLKTPEVKNLTFELHSEDGNLIQSTEAALDAFGTSSGSFTLPSGARLGGYTISTESGTAYFQTERYVKSPFKVTFEASAKAYTLPQNALVKLTAERFEGLPLSGAEVEINTISQNNMYECDYYYDGGCSYDDKFESRKTYTLPSNGTLSIPISLSNLFSTDDYRDNDRIIDTVARVTDSNGRSVSGKTSYAVARSLNNLEIEQSQYYGSAGKPVTTTFILTKRENNTPVLNAPIEVFVDRITWEYVERQEQDGNFYKKWQKKITPVQQVNLATNEAGRALFTWQPAKNGEYRIRGRNGNGARNENYFYVEGAGSGDIISEPNNNNNLNIKMPERAVTVGETIPVIISTLQTQGLALVSMEQADIINHSVIRFTTNSFVYNLKIEKQYIPNVTVSVTILDNKGNISHASQDLSVNTNQKELSITIKNNKEQYLPGEKATVSVLVKDQAGAPVPNADVSIAVVDQSILALYGNVEKDLVEFFYSYYPNLVSTISNMVSRLHVIDINLGNGAKGGDGGSDLSKKQRGVFKDTAFWTDHVYTDQNGIATTEFTFPDNLTYWQTEAVVNTKDNLFGSARSVIQTAKLISTEPILPRFLSYGDTFSIPVQIFNRTKSSADVKLTVTSKTLLVDKPYVAVVPVPANSTRTQYVPMAATTDQNIKLSDLNINVAYKDLYDEVSYTIPMHSSNIFEYVATGAYSPNGSLVERIKPQGVNKGDGVITIRAGATAGEYISKGLLGLAEYLYGCLEQKASKAATLSLLIKLNEDYNIGGEGYDGTVFDGKENVSTIDALKNGVEYMESQIRESGGYGYYESMPDDYELTVAVGESLLDIKENGTVDVSQEVLEKIALYVYGQMSSKSFYTNQERIETLTRGLVLLDRMEFDEDGIKEIAKRIEPMLEDKKELQKVSGNTLVSALLLSDNDVFGGSIEGLLEDEINSRMSINSRGAYISSRSDYYHYDSDLSATALYLSHIIAKKDYNNPITYKMLNWITEHQGDNGLIGSTRDSIRVVRALVNFFEETQNESQRSTISIYLGSQLLESKKTTKDNIFEPLVKNISDNDLDYRKINTIRAVREGIFGSDAPLFLDIVYKYSIEAKTALAVDRGFSVTREYGNKKPDGNGVVAFNQGEIVKVSLKITTNKHASLIGIDDAVPAGFEIINENLETEKGEVQVLNNENRGEIYYATLYPSHTETHDDRRFVFVDSLSPGTYIYEYYVRARTVGTFTGYPAGVSELYSPEVFGRSAGVTVMIKR